MRPEDGVTNLIDGTTAVLDTPRKRRAVLLGTGGALLGLSMLPSTPTARASVSTEELTAEGDEITSHDGSIDALPFEPTIGIAWEGVNANSTMTTLSIVVTTEGESDMTVYEESVTLEGTNGNKIAGFDIVNLLDEGWSAETFEAPDNASTEETDIDVSVTLVGDGIDEAVADTLTVVVHNHPASVDVGGTVETSIESDEEV